MSKPLSSPVGIPTPQPVSSQPQSERRALSRFLVLEPRVLLDAAALETADKLLADAMPHHDGADGPATEALADALLKGQAGTAALSAAGGASEVLFVDADVQGYEELIRNLGGNVEVHILTGSDWAGQIQAVLGRRDGDVSAIHLVSHGSAGRLVLGGEAVDAGSLDRYAQAWSAMHQALTAEGDLLLYGCDVAAGDLGQSFIQALTERTGADIAASEDLSGVASLGGNWELEYQAGEIGTHSLFADGANGFDGLLADAWVQDTEISAGTSSVAITHTAQGDFKFVGTHTGTGVGPGDHGKVDVYRRDEGTGEWVFFQSLNHTTDGGTNPVGAIKAQFGYSIAAAGNKLVVSAPAFDPSTANASDGRVFVFTWNGTTWASGVQRIDYIAIQGSGQTGFNGGSPDINGSRGTADQWGYSVDIATDGNGNYRLVIGNPYEDWYEYDDDDNDGTWGGNAVTRNERDDVGAAVVLQATSHGSFGTAYNQITQMYGWTSLTADNLYFGSTTAVGYDAPDSNGDPGHWWVAVGGSGLDKVRVYLDPAANTTINGSTYTQQFDYTGSSPNNITMDDDWMVIGNASSLQAYKLTGTTWTAAGSAFGGANAVVFIADRDYSWSSPTNQPPIIVYSGLADGVLYTYTAIWDTSTNQFDPTDLINTGRQEVAVAIDRYRALDILVANASGSQSWHYNWDPVANDDVMTGNEDASFSFNVISNDTDINKDIYGVFGDSLVIDGVTASIFGATVTFTGTTVTYNPTTSSYLQTLALGQTAQEKLLVTIRDGQGGFSTSDLIVNIEGRNDAPVVTSIIPLDPFRQQQSNSTVSYDLSVYFNDIDQGENTALVPEVTGLPSGWTWTVDGSYLLLTIPASGATAADGYQGTITVRMKDPHGATSPTRNFKIVVDAVNNAPVLQSAIADQVALAQNAFSFQVPASSFHDPDPAPFDVLTYSATLSGGGPLPSWLVFDAENRLFVGTPAAGDVGTITVRVTVTDKGGLTATDDFVISVVNPSQNTVTQFYDGVGSNADFGFSTAISQSGEWMVVGSPGWSSSRGEVRYFQWNGSGWTYRGTLAGVTANDQFGWSVDIDDTGSKIVVGARNVNSGRGAAYVYSRPSGTTFSLSATYTANGAQQNDYFGTSVAINDSGTQVVIGASHYDSGGVADSGAAFLAATSSGGALTANILPKDPDTFDRFGTTVAFDQNIVVVSAIGADNASGIVARLQFEESDGIYASASIGGVGGTLGVGTGFVNDPVRGNVVRFTDGNSVINLDSAIDLGDSWTISTWYNGVQSNGTWRTLVRGSLDHQIIVQDGTNVLGVYNNTAGTFVSSGHTLTAAQLTGWHHIVAVGEGTTTRFYIDGVLVGTANFKSTSDIVAVGNYQGLGQKFANMLDDFRVYDRALTQSEIRNIYTGVAQSDGQYNDMGALYVFSTDVGGQNQVAKLYAPDGHALDMLGWSISVDVYNVGGMRMSGIIAASSIYNDQAATDGGAVYVWRSNDLQSGGDQWNGQAGNGTWDLETKLVSYDVKSGDYFGYAVAVDADETTGNARIVVGTPFESSNGAYAGAVYAYKYQGGVWLPEKFVDANPQGGSQASAAFFGNAVGVAVNSGTSMARAVFTSRWHSTGAETRDGAAYSVNLLTQGNYMTLMAAQVPVFESFSVPAPMAFAVDNSATQGEVGFNEEGLLVYTPGESFRALAAGETATDSFVYYTQQNGVVYENEVVVTVQGQDHEPEAADDVVYVAANATGVLDVLGNDTAGLALLSVDAPALVGSLRIEGNRLVYDPQGRFDSLRTGEAVQQGFRYTALDGQGREVSGNVVLLVTGVDRWPTAVDDTATVDADGVVTVNVVANDSQGSSGTAWLSGLDTSGSIGSFSYDGDGVVRYVPGEAFAALRVGETATDRVVYTLRDAYGHESSGLLVVTITGTNDGSTPVEPGLPMPHDDVATTQGMTPVRIAVSDNDGGGQVISATAGAHGEVVVQEDGSLLYVPGSTLAMLPAGTVQVDSFSYVVEYEGGRRETATVQVHVNGRYFVPAQEQDEDWRDKLVIVPLSSLSDAYAPPAIPDGAGETALPTHELRDNVAALALDGMVEMAAEEGAGLDLPSEADTAALPPLADNGSGKPALSALLRREVLARQAGMDALLRHFGERAA